tara:strand:+ start:5131 stop:5403 length:273 start_codon:yes stop_codon:yes gene_type:complete
MSAEAATYLTHGKKADGRNASMVMVHAKTTHVIHSSCQTHLLELVFIDRKIAKAATAKKTKSTARHQVGAPLQQTLEQACATNKKGVAKQ